ncbi:alpha/beta hydrolase [Herpetosiphon llansteffanensis]
MQLSRVDPELQPYVRRIPPLPLGSNWGRRFVRWLGKRLPSKQFDGVSIEQHNELNPPLRIYRPAVCHSSAALVWIHGGGMIIGQAAQDDQFCATTAQKLGIVVVSIDYRLAPEHPFPAPLDDCFAGWHWLQQHSPTLGVDPTQVIIGGESAGGGLAASLVQRLFDLGQSQPLGQLLLCPMLDDRTTLDQGLTSIDHFVWNNHKNMLGWQAYLGQKPSIDELPAYAIAARRVDLAGLPATWIGVGDIDLFYEENRCYAERLQAADVDVTFEVVAGGPHGFQNWAFGTAIGQRFIAKAHTWLQNLLEPAND